MQEKFGSQLTNKQQQWLVENNKEYPVKCKQCGIVNTKWLSGAGRFATYCSPLCREIDKENLYNEIKGRNTKKYGVGNVFQVPDHQDRYRTTLFTRHGVTNPSVLQEVKNKKKQTTRLHHGVDNPQHCEHIRALTAQTLLARYGVTNPSQSLDIRQKTINTWMQKYGVDNPRKSQAVRNKIKSVWMQKYGVDNPSKHPDVKNNIMLTAEPHMEQILPQLLDVDWLAEQYLVYGMSAEAIANNLGCTAVTVLRYLHQTEVAIRQGQAYSYACISWLESLNNDNIQHALNGGEYCIPDTPYRVDGYDPTTNTVYEFHGDVWHGNPAVFLPNERCHPYSDLTAGDLYDLTKQREDRIKSMGFNLVVMWESEWTKQKSSVDIC